MRKTLIIYETTHTETLPAFLLLADKHFSGITICMPESSYIQMQELLKDISLQNDLSWILQTDESHKAFITSFCKTAAAFTHVHISTLEHNLLFFCLHLRRLKHAEISMTVHSINDYHRFLFRGARDISESMAKLWLHRNIHRYRVLAPAMATTFKEYFTGKTVCFIPANFSKLSITNQVKQNNRFTIVIPGTVEAKRRDYDLVVSFLQKHIRALAAISSINLVLAGSANSDYGRKIVASLQAFEHEHFSLQHFAGEVPQRVFNELYTSADIIWSPMNIQMESLRGVAEINGVTHSPGFIGDQIYFQKPAIITKGLQLPKALREVNFEYETEDELLEIFLGLLNDPGKQNELSAKLKKACVYFQPSNFDAAFRTLMNLDAPKA